MGITRNKSEGFCNKINILIILIAGFVLFGSTLFGCKKKTKTSTEYGYITFSLDWDNVIGESSESMRFCFYPEDNGPMIQTDTDSGVLKMALPAGNYSLFVYNIDKKHIQLRNRNSFNDLEAYFTVDKLSGSGISALPLYGVVLNELEITPNQDVEMELKPSYFTKKVTFHIHTDPSLFSVLQDGTAILKGVTPVMHINDRKLRRDSTMEIPFELEAVSDHLLGQTYLWNGTLENEDEVEYEMILTFTLTNGKQVKTSLKIGSSLFKLKEKHVLVRINVTEENNINGIPVLSSELISLNSQFLNVD